MSNSSEEMLRKAEEIYSKVLKTIKKGIDDTFNFKEPLSSAANHYFQAEGKGLRPALTVFSCEATGGLEEEAIHVAAAIETLHTFTLVHDDIMDNDDLRRNVPTVHKKWNVDTAILTGDAQLSLAFWLLTQANIPSDITTHIIKRLAEVMIELAIGQQSDIDFVDQPVTSITVEQVLEMMEKKTGVLIELCAEAGAILGTKDANTPLATLLGTFAKKTGIAFQIQDDLLDLLQTTEKLGKQQGGDVKEGKRTIIAVHAFNNATEEQKEKMEAIFEKSDATVEEIGKFIELLNEIGSIEYAKKIKEQLVEEAFDSLKEAGLGEKGRHIEAIGEYLVKRTY
ncbi:MAG: polyprenyl synthetase family protein [Candidatus Heimdallarchaeota archaeon]|nr:polyprenyl synthetase family protein [Candidatus Heimdallarchaeota archaeon]MCK5048399.1 polyprenyl synthetase family protein [Candidatus Heimdallarchaeota archaeon]